MSAVYRSIPHFELLHDWGTKLHRSGYKFQPERTPLYEQVDIMHVMSRRSPDGRMLWIVFGTFGHRALVSFQEHRMDARNVMFFHLDSLMTQFADATSDLHRYARRLRYTTTELMQSCIDALHYKNTAKP